MRGCVGCVVRGEQGRCAMFEDRVLEGAEKRGAPSLPEVGREGEVNCRRKWVVVKGGGVEETAMGEELRSRLHCESCE